MYVAVLTIIISLNKWIAGVQWITAYIFQVYLGDKTIVLGS